MRWLLFGVGVVDLFVGAYASEHHWSHPGVMFGAAAVAFLAGVVVAVVEDME